MILIDTDTFSPHSVCKPRLPGRTRGCYTVLEAYLRTRAHWHFTKSVLFLILHPNTSPSIISINNKRYNRHMLLGKSLTRRPKPTSLRSVLQGTVSPLVGIGACVSIQFGALEYTKRTLAQMNLRAGRGGKDGKELSGPQLVAAGSIAGIANSIVSGPVEHIRIRAWITFFFWQHLH